MKKYSIRLPARSEILDTTNKVFYIEDTYDHMHETRIGNILYSSIFDTCKNTYDVSHVFYTIILIYIGCTGLCNDLFLRNDSVLKIDSYIDRYNSYDYNIYHMDLDDVFDTFSKKIFYFKTNVQQNIVPSTIFEKLIFDIDNHLDAKILFYINHQITWRSLYDLMEFLKEQQFIKSAEINKELKNFKYYANGRNIGFKSRHTGNTLNIEEVGEQEKHKTFNTAKDFLIEKLQLYIFDKYS